MPVWVTSVPRHCVNTGALPSYPTLLAASCRFPFLKLKTPPPSKPPPPRVREGPNESVLPFLIIPGIMVTTNHGNGADLQGGL